MSAPSASGRWASGVAKVLSTTSRGRSPFGASVSRERPGDGSQVDDLEVRVGGRLDPDHPRPIGQAGGQRGHRVRRQVDVGGRDAVALRHAFEVAVGAAVDVVAAQDRLARRGELRDDRRRRGSAGEGQAVAPALELGHGALEARTRRVLGPCVFPAPARLSDAVLRIGAGLVDRRRDGAGQLVGLLAGMHRQRLEVQAAVIVAHGAHATRARPRPTRSAPGRRLEWGPDRPHRSRAPEGADRSCPVPRSPSSAPATSARPLPSASPRLAWRTSSWSTSSRACPRARRSTCRNRRRSWAMTGRSRAPTTTPTRPAPTSSS